MALETWRLEIPRRSLVILFALSSAVASAQWLNYPTPGTPRTAGGKPILTAPAPHASDGKPDLSGVWRVEPTPVAELRRIFGGFIDVAEKITVPGMELGEVNKYFISVLADFQPAEAPLRPEFAAALRQRAGAEVPTKVCLPAGPLALYQPDPHKIAQTPTNL